MVNTPSRFIFNTESGRIEIMTQTGAQPISSFRNPKIQLVRTLLNDRSARSKNGMFIVEGIRLAEEALSSHLIPHSVFYSSQLSARGKEILDQYHNVGIEIVEVYADVLDRLSDTETSQGILLVMPQMSIPLPASADLVLIIDQLRDPGNMGTILRSAAATGVQVVFITPGSVDPFMPKVLRAGMGAHFRLCIQQSDWTQVVEYCKSTIPSPLQVLLAEPGSGSDMWQTVLTQPLALVVGGEAEGPSQPARANSDALIHIPMPGNFESLNAGVAASILLYEVVRQRNS